MTLSHDTHTNGNSDKWSEIVKTEVVRGHENPLSNFYMHEVNVFGQSFPSVEHAYQYKKMMDHNLSEKAELIKSAGTAKEAKGIADGMLSKEQIHDWENKSLETMRQLLRIKFSSCTLFSQKLMNTKNRKIVHPVHSRFWGTGSGIHGTGKNMFGKLLTELRDNSRSKNLPKVELQTSQEELEKSGSQNISESVSESEYESTENGNCDSRLPQVTLVGNSLLQGIKGDKLLKGVEVKKISAYTIQEAEQVISEMTSDTDAVIFQLITNDVKSQSSSLLIAENFKVLIEKTMDKFPNASIVLSNPPIRMDDSQLNLRSNIVSGILNEYFKDTAVICLLNENVTFLTRDGVHLTPSGTSRLARNMKETIAQIFNLEPVQNHDTYNQVSQQTWRSFEKNNRYEHMNQQSRKSYQHKDRHDSVSHQSRKPDRYDQVNHQSGKHFQHHGRYDQANQQSRRLSKHNVRYDQVNQQSTEPYQSSDGYDLENKQHFSRRLQHHERYDGPNQQQSKRSFQQQGNRDNLNQHSVRYFEHNSRYDDVNQSSRKLFQHSGRYEHVNQHLRKPFKHHNRYDQVDQQTKWPFQYHESYDQVNQQQPKSFQYHEGDDQVNQQARSFQYHNRYDQVNQQQPRSFQCHDGYDQVNQQQPRSSQHHDGYRSMRY